MRLTILMLLLLPATAWAEVSLAPPTVHGKLLEVSARDPLADAVRTLQPNLAPGAATIWAGLIREADTDAGIGDPWLLAALVRRESSFFADVADGRTRGALGEVGPLQVKGAALRLNPCPQGGARCWLRCGARFLARRRQDCPGSTWRWVQSYGMRRCASEAEARRGKSARRAKYFYDKAGGVLWPI